MTTSFAALHVPGAPLVIPNAWDAGSAAVLAASGAAAVATTSGGVAWSLGYPDGNAISADDLVAVVARMARVIDVPLSADIESGLSLDPGAVADLAARVAEAGAVGINLEDSWDGAILAAEVQAERLHAVTERTPELFVNARVDAFLYGVNDALSDVITRADLFAEAGAGALFVPGLLDLATIAEVVRESPLPVAVMGGAGAPPVSALADAGVARISTGTDLADMAYGRLRTAATALLRNGDFTAVEAGYGYGELNALFRN